MSDIPIEIMARRILQIIIELNYADEAQIQTYRGMLADCRDILKMAKVNQAELVGALESANFTTELAKKLLQ